MNGNYLTNLMHFITFLELKKMHVSGAESFTQILPEKEVELKKEKPRLGRFDFFAQTSKGKSIGVEVLTRPSKGKMKEKLSYSREVDEFVFVIPEHFLDFYKKHEKNGLHDSVRKKFLPKEFADKKLFVWILDSENHRFTRKGSFSEVFNVNQQKPANSFK